MPVLFKCVFLKNQAPHPSPAFASKSFVHLTPFYWKYPIIFLTWFGFGLLNDDDDDDDVDDGPEAPSGCSVSLESMARFIKWADECASIAFSPSI